MRAVALLLCLACAGRKPQRAVAPDALKGVQLALAPAADVRRTPGVGCGQVDQELAPRANRYLARAFAETGASLTVGQAPWTLEVGLRDAVMGPENEMRRPTDRPVVDWPHDAPPLSEPRPSAFNSGNSRAEVQLDATLLRNGQVAWRDTITGRANSGPCIEAVPKVREALSDAIAELRDRVVEQIRRRR